MVENLVKNWEIEASFKIQVSDWRTVDHDNYTFAINGGPPQDAAHMLKVGTYNAIIAPSPFYSPEYSDFEKSHKTFKKMMPTFAWEVLEVYSGPPTVAFKWRHWGEMKGDYEGWNEYVRIASTAVGACANNNVTSKGEKITFKAHGGLLDIQGMTVAKVDDGFKVQALETWFDPLEMFRQFTPKDTQVDGKTLSAESADKMVQGKDGVETLTGQLEGAPMASAAGIGPNAGAPPSDHHGEAPPQAPGISGCPFLPTR
jgi:hypothetical protein